MRCNGCGFEIPWEEGQELTECNYCKEGQFFDTTDDIFLLGKYNLVTEKREVQADYARDIQDRIILEKKGVALIEAGTGIGKSFAYTVPTVIADKRVVISTATKNLQQQLGKDVPYVLETLGIDKKSAVYKGAQNYGCPYLFKKIKDSHAQSKFKTWADGHLGLKQPADLSNWKGVKPPWWAETSAENCLYGGACKHSRYCRPMPAMYQVLIVNHSLLAIDLLLTKRPGSIFGPYDMLVIDEAHKAPGYFRNALTNSLTKPTFERAINAFTYNTPLITTFDSISRKYKSRNAKATLNSLLRTFQQVLKTLHHDEHKQQARRIQNIEDIEEYLLTMIEESRVLYTNLENSAAKALVEVQHRKKGSGFAESFDEVNAAISSMRKLLNSMRRTHETCIRIATSKEDEEIITLDNKGLHIQPIDIGPSVERAFSSIPYKIITSATLKVGSDFQHTRSLYGIQPSENVHEATYEGTFDYDNQVRMYMPPEMPLPKYDDEGRAIWVDAQAKEIRRLVQGTNGDALVLFTAKKDLNDIWDALDHESLEAQGLNLVRQEGDAAYALQQFQAQRQSVLFGLKSFWEGVDLPGQQLRLVIITKLPFPPKGDPLFEALRGKVGANAFSLIDIPEMVTDMRQAVGRLIRTQNDYGVVAILDPRIWTGNATRHYSILRDIQMAPAHKRKPKGYGWQLIKALGYRKRAKTFTDAIAFANKNTGVTK